MDKILTKVCFKCEVEKVLSEFYPHKKMADGHLNKCKECNKDDVKKDYYRKSENPEWIKQERERGRDRYLRLNYKDRFKKTPEEKSAIAIRYKDKYPEKYKAKNISQRIKVLVKGNHLHHWNYNIEFAKDVIELNPIDHVKIHRFIKYDQKTFMYKDLNGILLDTKEKHQNLINKILENF